MAEEERLLLVSESHYVISLLPHGEESSNILYKVSQDCTMNCLCKRCQNENVSSKYNPFLCKTITNRKSWGSMGIFWDPCIFKYQPYPVLKKFPNPVSNLSNVEVHVWYQPQGVRHCMKGWKEKLEKFQAFPNYSSRQ